MEINLASNVNDVMRNVSNLHRRQVPFALSQAMNEAAFEVRSEIVQRTYPRAFTVRNSRFINAVMRVAKATKSNLVASVFDQLGRDYLERHSKGGTKTPKGQNLAIPSDNVARNAGGSVRAAQRPRNLLQRKDAFKLDVKGNSFIAKRDGKARYPIRLLYLLEPRASIAKSFAFYEDAIKVVKERLPDAWSKAWGRAIRTAK